ncbi:MAG: DNRLRE domain-containing protein [Bacteroidales bacterium]
MDSPTKAVFFVFLHLWTLLSAVNAQHTVIIQPGPVDGMDCYINSAFPDVTGGLNEGLIACAWTFNGDFGIGRSLIKFDLTSIPAGAIVTNARLTLYYDASIAIGQQYGANASFLQPITADWDQMTTTWNNKPPVNTVGQISVPATLSLTEDLADIDMTALVQGWVNDPATNFGFSHRMQVEVTYCSVVYSSSNKPIAAKRPKLVVTYNCDLPMTLGADRTICDGDVTTFDAGFCAGCTYQWDNLTTGQTNIGTGQTFTTGIAGEYKVTVTGANGCMGSDIVQLYINPLLTVSVSITSSSTSVCEGSTVNFTAFASMGGNAPLFQWKVNGLNQGLNDEHFSWIPTNGDCITCSLSSSSSCTTGNPAISNQICIAVTPAMVIGVNIAPTANPVCAGTSVTFICVPINGGVSPAYQWKVNGMDAGGATNSIYSFIPLNGNTIQCTVSAAEACITGSPANSNTIIMTVNPLLPVSLAAAVSANPVCSGTQVTGIATPVNEGTSPVYQWSLNGTNIPGATNPTYSFVPANGNLVQCVLTSSEACTTGNPATSNVIIMDVNSMLPVSLSILASANPVCAGTTVTYTATPINGGILPGFQWMVNGTGAGSNVPFFDYVPVTGDQVSCQLNSSLGCVNNNPAVSGTIIMNTWPVPGVTFSNCFDQMTSTDAKPFKLKGGLPLGGIYSGAGVNSLTGVFDPAIAGIGIHVINYSYTNTYSCSSVAAQSITSLSAVPFTCGNLLTDIRDNNSYPTVQIGTQCWMQTNLDFGATISDLLLQTDNCLAEKYHRNSKFVNQYSIFYQWDELMRYTTAQSPQGLCPPGWHVPSSAEWDILLTTTEGPGLAGGTLQDMFLVNGFRSEQHGIFYMNRIWAFAAGITAGSMYWTSTPSGATRAVARGINEFNLGVSKYEGARGNAFSVRCLTD